MKITNFEVLDREIKKLGDNKLVGLVNQDKFVINFKDKDWNGLHKSFKLQRSDKKVVNLPLDLEDSVILSQECYLEGWSKLWFEGTLNENTPEELIVALTEPLEIYFSPKISGDIVPIGIPKPSEWEIIIGQMNAVKEDIIDMKNTLDTEVDEILTHLHNHDYDGRGITSIDKVKTEGLEDTYEILYTDDTKSQIIITNGANGKDGENGLDGQNGKDGIDGQDGVGVSRVIKDSSQGLIDVYKMILTNGNYFEYNVTNGRNGIDGINGLDGADGVSITDIVKVSTVGLVSTYNIKLSDGTIRSFTVTDGANGRDGIDGRNGIDGERGVGILDITKTSTSGLIDTYTVSYSDGTTSEFRVTNGRDGVTPSLDGYATEEYVDRKINDSITNMLGGAY